MNSTAVCAVRPARADFGDLSKGIAVLARATRSLFARLFQGGKREADVKQDLMVGDACWRGTTRGVGRTHSRPHADGENVFKRSGSACATGCRMDRAQVGLPLARQMVGRGQTGFRAR